MGVDLNERWFDAHPERLRWELAEFERLGLPATLEHLGNYVAIETELPYESKNVRITALFPFDYPNAAPEFSGPKGLLQRHQNLAGYNLCWAPDSDAEWSPRMSAASVIDTNIRALLEDSESGSDTVLANEADMPEPFSGFIARQGGGQVAVIPEPFLSSKLAATEGEMVLHQEGGRVLLHSAAGLGTVDHQLEKLFLPRGKAEPTGHWAELEDPPGPAAFNGNESWDVAAAVPVAFQRAAARARKRRSASADFWLGLTFMEEGPIRGEFRRNWVIGMVRYQPATGNVSFTWLPTQALTREERRRRTPELVGLEDAHVLLVGAGSVGSPVGFELAKAGIGSLDIVDNDIFDVNNCVRHGLPVICAGRNKADAVAEYARGLNPFIEVTGHSSKVEGDAVDAAELVEIVENATVVIDTTGSNQVTRLLQSWCASVGRPLVIADLTDGSYGGTVRIVIPDQACFECMLLAQEDGLIPRPETAPETSLVTPIGCSHPAFSGAGYEATHLAAVAARAVVQTTNSCAYPAAGFNWAVMNFRSAPRWRSGMADIHPHCWRHA